MSAESFDNIDYPDYRILYEREQELREVIEKLYDYSQTDFMLVDHKAWEELEAHYEKLKAKYNDK